MAQGRAAKLRECRAKDRRFWGGKSRLTWVLFCAVEREDGRPLCPVCFDGAGGIADGNGHEPTLSQAAWDGPSQAGRGGYCGLRTRLFVMTRAG
jgi:hypothetical protein